MRAGKRFLMKTAKQKLIENSGLKVITRNQCLEQKSVFKAIFAVLKAVLNPFDNQTLAWCYETLADLGFFKRGLGNEISKYDSSFVTLKADSFQYFDLEKFYWDISYFIFALATKLICFILKETWFGWKIAFFAYLIVVILRTIYYIFHKETIN